MKLTGIVKSHCTSTSFGLLTEPEMTFELFRRLEEKNTSEFDFEIDLPVLIVKGSVFPPTKHLSDWLETYLTEIEEEIRNEKEVSDTNISNLASTYGGAYGLKVVDR